MTYKFITKIDPSNGDKSNDTRGIIRKADGAFIPNDPDNVDNQKYLEWAKTNTPEEAD